MRLRQWVTAALIGAGLLSTPRDSFASCVTLKTVSTYNAATGGVAYWVLPSGYPEASAFPLQMRMWQLGNRAGTNEGTCNFLYALPSGVDLTGNLADSCFNGCPSGRLITVAQAVSQDRRNAVFIAGTVDETPGGALAYDYSVFGNRNFVTIPRPITSNVRSSGGNILVDVAVGSVAAGAFGPAGTAVITGYNIVDATVTPDRLATRYVPVATIPGATGGAVHDVVLACPSPPSPRNHYLAVQIVFDGSVGTPYVGATADPISCPPCTSEPCNDVIRGSIVLLETFGDTLNTSSVPSITTLTPFGVVTPSSVFDTPADIELLTTDARHVYQLTASGAVSRYDASGFNAAVSTIAPPTGQWTDMATDPTTGIVYGAATQCDNSTLSTLHTLNLLGGTRVQLGTVTNSRCLTGLAFDNGGNLFGFDGANDSLISINKVTGAGTIVGSAGFNANFAQAMDCDPSTGTCYLFGHNASNNRQELRTFNLTTGATTVVNTIGSVSPGGQVSVAGAVFGTFGSCTMDSDCSDDNPCNGFENCVNTQCQLGTPIECDDGLFCTIDSCNAVNGSCEHSANRCADDDSCTLDTCNESSDLCMHTPLTPIQFCNSASITIPTSGQATPYPSTITVSGLPAAATLCSVQLSGIAHTNPTDIDILLSGPAGASPSAIIMSDVGGQADVIGVNLVLTDVATSILTNGPLVSGTYRPTNVDTGPDVFPAPAPTPSGQTKLDQWFGLNANGVWKLWVDDDASFNGGRIANGWCLNIAPLTCGMNSDCDDNNVCNGAETCIDYECQAGMTVNCEDGNVCTDDSCNATSGCVHAFNTIPCDDGNACTTGDMCGGGMCNGGPPPSCDDGDVCTDDSCDATSGCVHANNTSPCDDGNACTTGDMCGGGTCSGGSSPNCDDGDCCTIDSCDESTGCVHAANPTTPSFTTQPSLGACPVLWPPSHGYADFEVAQTGAAATSQCPIISIQFASCSSSQGENAVNTGDGNSVRDCVFSGSTLSLRAERNGACSPLGRVYTTRLVATDVCGHTAMSDTLEVSVWHGRAQPPVSANIFHGNPGSDQDDTRPGVNGNYAADPDACGTGSSCANGTVADHSDADPEMEIAQGAATSVNDLKLSKVNGILQLSWTTPDLLAPINVTRFHVYRRDPVTFSWTYVAELPKQQLTYTDPIMNDGRNWQYKVSAIIK
jgi:hypothetical protein